MTTTPETFAAIYDKYAAAFYGSIVRKVENTETANLIFEKAFFSIFKNFHHYSPQDSTLFTWMMNIVQREIRSTMTPTALLKVCQ